MNVIVSSTTVASLFIHALLGCCWHHPHGSPSPSDSAKALPLVCCHHGHEQARDHSKPAPAKSPRQCEGVCVYLPSHKTQNEGPAVLIPFDLPAVSALVAEVNGALDPAWQRTSEPGKWLPSVRLHILHQILLV